MSTQHPAPAVPVAPMRQAADALNQQELSERAIVVLRQADALDTIEGKILEQRLDGQEGAEAYLYIIPAKGERKPIVGPTVDFVRQIVRSMNLTGRTQLTVATEQRPVIQDVVINGKPYVRALVCAIDRKTGEVKWGVKEEPRLTAEGQPLHHAATIAVEKAERKALESHPSYNRKFVNRKIREFVERAGLDPKLFIIGGGTGQWSDFFGRARKAGLPASELRQQVRDRTGKGLSEIQSREEAITAAAAVDEIIPNIVGADGEVPARYSTSDVVEIGRLQGPGPRDHSAHRPGHRAAARTLGGARQRSQDAGRLPATAPGRRLPQRRCAGTDGDREYAQTHSQAAEIRRGLSMMPRTIQGAQGTGTRSTVDMADLFFGTRLTMAAGGLWWLSGHPGAAMVVIGVGLAILGLLSSLR